MKKAGEQDFILLHMGQPYVSFITVEEHWNSSIDSL